jgi:hypothetical protein
MVMRSRGGVSHNCHELPTAPLLYTRRPNGEIDYGALASSLVSELPSASGYLLSYGSQPMPSGADIAAAASLLASSGSGQQHAPGAGASSKYGPRDPLSRDPLESWPLDQLESQVQYTHSTAIASVLFLY